MAVRRRRPGVRRRDTALPLVEVAAAVGEVATAVEKVAAAAAVVEEEEATGEDVTDLDPGSATAIATAIGNEVAEGAAPIDGKETALRAIGTATEEEEVEVEVEAGGTETGGSIGENGGRWNIPLLHLICIHVRIVPS